MWNFSPVNLDVFVKMGGMKSEHSLSSGANLISLDCSGFDLLFSCSFDCVPWCPKQYVESHDNRYLGFHLKEIYFD